MDALSALALAALGKAKVIQAEDRRRLGSAYIGNEHDLVFTDEPGRQLKPANATGAFARIAKRAGVSVKRLHSTRHTAATLMLISGVDVLTTSGVLGHRNPTQTLATYGHVYRRGQARGR